MPLFNDTLAQTVNIAHYNACEVITERSIKCMVIVVHENGDYRMKCPQGLDVNVAIGVLTRAAMELNRLKES